MLQEAEKKEMLSVLGSFFSIFQQESIKYAREIDWEPDEDKAKIIFKQSQDRLKRIFLDLTYDHFKTCFHFFMCLAENKDCDFQEFSRRFNIDMSKIPSILIELSNIFIQQTDDEIIQEAGSLLAKMKVQEQ